MRATYFLCLALVTAGSAWSQGTLAPPGPPDDNTMKTLDQLYDAIRVVQGQVTALEAKLDVTSNALVEANAALESRVHTGFLEAGAERAQFYWLADEQLAGITTRQNAAFGLIADMSNRQVAVQSAVSGVSNRLGNLVNAQYTVLSSRAVTSTVILAGTDNKFSSVALAFDRSGRPMIGYWSDGSHLMHGTWHGVWSFRQIDPVGDAGQGNSLRIAPNGTPCVAYADSWTRDLKYGFWSGSAWVLETVDDGGTMNHGWYSSLAFTAAGHPAISYFNATGRNLHYAQWNGSSWEFRTVDAAPDTGLFGSSLQFTSTGNPVVAYYDYTNRDLKYAAWNGTSWAVQTVDSPGDVGREPSMALSPSGHPAIAYPDDTNHTLKLAKWNGTAWEIEVVDANGPSGVSFAFTPAGQPAIAYRDTTNWCQKYAVRSGAGWTIVFVDYIEPTAGSNSSLNFTPSGNAAIGYIRLRSVMYAEVISPP